MAKLDRKLQRVFASSPGSNQLGKIGSLAAGTVEYTTDVEEMQSLSQYLAGLYGILIGGDSPAAQDFNALFNVTTYQLAYLFQQGVAEWNTSTEYHLNSMCQVDGVVYISNANTNQGNLVTDETWWRPYSSEPVASGKDYWGSVLPRGWLWADGKTIGNASSNATGRANADTFSLFSVLWSAGTDATLPIFTSAGAPTTRGSTAASDFASNRALSLPDKRGRVSVASDNLGGTAASRVTSTTMTPNGTTVGSVGGTQTHTLTEAQMPAHTHTMAHTHTFSGTTSGQSVSHTHNFSVYNDPGANGTFAGGRGSGAGVSGTVTTSSASADHTHTYSGTTSAASNATTSTTGSGTAHLNMQPSIVCNYIIKL